MKLSDLNYELYFLRLFGYKINILDNNNIDIIDEFENIIGHISSKNKNITIYIESDFLYFSNSRTNQPYSNFDYNYEFDIKKDEITHVHLKISDNDIGLSICNKTYNFMDFHLNNSLFFVTYKSKTKKFNLKEIIILTHSGENTQYNYSITYSNLNGKTTTEELEIKTKSENLLELRNKKTNKKIKEKYAICRGTINEAIVKHELGILAFSHYRYIINNILLFKDDIFKIILKDTKINLPELQIFFPDIELTNTKKYIKK